MKVDYEYVPQTVEEFFEPPVGHWRFGAFPPDSLLISEAFEVGGTYETWGWIMYEKSYVDGSAMPGHGGAVYRLKTFASARTLPKLLEQAEMRMRGIAMASSVGRFFRGESR